MPLAIAPIGKEVTLIKYSLNTQLRKHLEDLGMIPGSKITVIKEKDGDVIIQVKGSRIAINKGLASNILVH